MSEQGTLIIRHDNGTEEHVGHVYADGRIWMNAGYMAEIRRVD